MPTVRALSIAWPLLGLVLPVAAQAPVPTCQVRGSHAWLSTRPSPLDSATVVIAGQTAKLCYSRPSARGRVVFDSLVPYGKLWRTGANEPTVLHLPVAADVAGLRLDPGSYMIFTSPRPGEWGVAIFVSDADDPVKMFQSMREVGVGTAPSEELSEHVETLTIRGVDGETAGELVLEWERVRVRIPVRASGTSNKD